MKILVLAALLLFVAGCAPVYYQHDPYDPYGLALPSVVVRPPPIIFGSYDYDWYSPYTYRYHGYDYYHDYHWHPRHYGGHRHHNHGHGHWRRWHGGYRHHGHGHGHHGHRHGHH